MNSWIKFFESGITENKYLFTSDFRIPKCSNPFVALPTDMAPVTSFFSVEENEIPAPAPEPVSMKSFEEDTYDWIMKNYDSDKDGYLDQGEVEALFKDLENYDYGKESIKVSDITKWIGDFDRNGDGKISLEELYKALA